MNLSSIINIIQSSLKFFNMVGVPTSYAIGGLILTSIAVVLPNHSKNEKDNPELSKIRNNTYNRYRYMDVQFIRSNINSNTSLSFDQKYRLKDLSSQEELATELAKMAVEIGHEL